MKEKLNYLISQFVVSPFEFLTYEQVLAETRYFLRDQLELKLADEYRAVIDELRRMATLGDSELEAELANTLGDEKFIIPPSLAGDPKHLELSPERAVVFRLIIADLVAGIED